MAEGVRVIRRPPAKRRAMHLIGPFGGATGQGHAQGVEDKDLYRAPGDGVQFACLAAHNMVNQALSDGIVHGGVTFRNELR